MQPLVLDLDVNNTKAISQINDFFNIYEKGVKGLEKDLSDALGKPVEKQVVLKMEGGELVAKVIDKIDKDVEAIVHVTRALNKEFGKTPEAIKKQLNALKLVQAVTEKYDQATGKVTQEWAKLAEIIKLAEGEAKKLGVGGLGDLEDKLISSQVAAQALTQGFTEVFNLLKQIVSTGAEMEVLFVQLKGFTGSAEAAAASYQKYVEIGQATAFTAKQVAEGAKIMQGFGLSTQQANTQIERMAVLATATGGNLGHMARNLGQIQANQRAYTRDLMQFANQGIPIYGTLAEVMGISVDKVKSFAEKGQIGYRQVAAAVEELTKKGSAYSVIASEIDATVSARLEALASAVENFAGQMVTMLNQIDRSLGGLVSGTLALVITVVNKIADAFGYIGRNAQQLAPVIGALTGAFVTLIGLAIVQNFQQIIQVMSTWKIYTVAQSIAQGALNVALAIGQALMGNWGTVLAAAAAGAVVATAGAMAVKNSLKEQSEALSDNKKRWDENGEAMNENVFITDDLTGATKKLVEEQGKIYDESKRAFEGQVEKIKALKEALIERYEAEKDKIQERLDKIKDDIKTEKDLYTDLREKVKTDYDQRIEKAKEELQAVRDRYDLELAELDKKSQAEIALEQIRRRELEAKVRNTELSAKERLEAQVQLEQMDKRVKRQQIMQEKKIEEKRINDEIKKIEKERDTQLDKIKTQYDRIIDRLEAQKKAEETALDRIEAKQKEAERYFNEWKNRERKKILENSQIAISELQKQIKKAEELEAAMKKAYSQAAAARNKQIEVQRGSSNSAPSKPGVNYGSYQNGKDYRFAGGPVSGGGVYTVNELGKEAFLSAAGHLSMINAPSFGSWRAPGAGTVIPAHLTSQLGIPAGGVNLNAGASASASRAGAMGGQGAMIKAIASALQGGDNIQNNVTIQSANTTKAASDILVELTKIKRRRYS